MPKDIAHEILTNHGKEVADVLATSTAIGAYLSWLPEIAALLAIIWTLIRIGDWMYQKYETFIGKERPKNERNEI